MWNILAYDIPIVAVLATCIIFAIYNRKFRKEYSTFMQLYNEWDDTLRLTRQRFQRDEIFINGAGAKIREILSKKTAFRFSKEETKYTKQLGELYRGISTELTITRKFVAELKKISRYTPLIWFIEMSVISSLRGSLFTESQWSLEEPLYLKEIFLKVDGQSRRMVHREMQGRVQFEMYEYTKDCITKLHFIHRETDGDKSEKSFMQGKICFLARFRENWKEIMLLTKEIYDSSDSLQLSDADFVGHIAKYAPLHVRKEFYEKLQPRYETLSVKQQYSWVDQDAFFLALFFDFIGRVYGTLPIPDPSSNGQWKRKVEKLGRYLKGIFEILKKYDGLREESKMIICERMMQSLKTIMDLNGVAGTTDIWTV